MNSRSLTQRIAQIEARNKKVEANKAWETSLTRRLLIVIATYIVMVLVMRSIGVVNYYVNAIIPTLGFFLSTLSFSAVKFFWLKYLYKS